MNVFQKAILAIRFTSLGQVNTALRYALMRDHLERGIKPSARKKAAEPLSQPKVQKEAGGASFDFGALQLEVRFLTPALARLTWTPGVLPPPYALARTEWEAVALRVEQDGADWTIASAALTVRVGANGGISYFDSDGSLLRRELPPQKRGSAWTHEARAEDGEHFYGMGERAAALDLRGGTFRLWNRDPGGSYQRGDDPLYLTMPLYLSQRFPKGYLIFYENSFDGQISFSGRSATAQFSDGALRFYFMPGAPAEALAAYTSLTGRAPMPPRWALGYHQSRWGYMNEGDIREAADGFREHNLPISAIHLDIDYMDGYRVFSVNRERFPNLSALSADMAERGIRLVTILDPGVKADETFDIFQQGKESGAFALLPNGQWMQSPVWPGWCTFPDFTSPKAREWWGGYYPRLLDAGIAGFWHDMNEPAAFAAWGLPTVPLTTRHALEGQGGDHRQAHNLYGLMMDRAGFEALRAQRPQKRPWLLSRSGWAGLQRYAWHWTGDTASDWDTLKMTIAETLNLGLSGIPYTGPDIGGFSGVPTPELFIRWFQMAAFLPFFRVHSSQGTPPREPWRFGEPFVGIAREFLRLRYRLIPYFYTLAWESHQNGTPLARPLFWDAPADPSLASVDDVFLLGDSLLVAPVTEEGAQARRVTLPSGGWYDFWDDRFYPNAGAVEAAAPLERIPLFARAGSLLPMEEQDRLQLHLYLSEDGEGASQLYSDAGDGYGEYRLERFRWMRRADVLDLRREQEGSFQPAPHPLHIFLHGGKAESVSVDGQPSRAEAGAWLLPRDFNAAQFRLAGGGE